MLFKIKPYIFAFLLVSMQPLMAAESQVNGTVKINISTKSIIAQALNDHSQAIVQIGSIKQSRTQSIDMNISTDKIVNIATGYRAKSLISIGSFEQANTGAIKENIHVKNIINRSANNHQTSRVIIGYYQ